MTRADEKDQDEDDRPVGIVCPRCECRHFSVVETRAESKGRIRRRRECRHCGHRITTYETTPRHYG